MLLMKLLSLVRTLTTCCTQVNLFISPVVSLEGSVTVSPQEAVVNLGEAIVLTCSAQGGPNVSYVWERNGVLIGNESIHSVMVADASSGGNFSCTVSNSAGMDSASTTLYVAPYIVTPLEEHILTANGSNVNISCVAAGFPSPTVNWVYEVNMEVSDTSTLVFRPVIFGDQGLYRCVATAEINGMNFTATNETTLIGMLSLCSGGKGLALLLQ